MFIPAPVYTPQLAACIMNMSASKRRREHEQKKHEQKEEKGFDNGRDNAQDDD